MHNLADVDDGGEDNDDDNDDRDDENDNEEDDDGFFLKLLNCLHSRLLRSVFFFISLNPRSRAV